MSAPLPSQNRPKIGNYRWTICALVFFATTINYLDRNVIGQLKETLLPLLRWKEGSNGEEEYGWMVNAFQFAYAFGLVAVGRIVDKIGSKRGYGAALFGWSISAIGHGFATGFLSFGAWRAALGITEAGNFPAAQKTVAEWFPKKERALATGVYNSGTNIGAILAPLVVPWLASHYIFGWSWQWAFVLTGAVGLLWLAFWFGIYKSPKQKLADGKLSQAEYDYIHGDTDEKSENEEDATKGQVSWFRLLTYRQTWAFFFGKFFTDGVWWFYLFWLPGFLSDENKRKLLATFTAGNTGGSGNALLNAVKATANGFSKEELVRLQEHFPNGIPDGLALADLSAKLTPETAAKVYQLTDGVSLHAAMRELQNFANLFDPSTALDKISASGVIIWPLAVAVVYSISVVGSVFGGYLPKRLVNSGMNVGTARKAAMFLYALLPLTVLSAMKLSAINTWLAVLVIGVGTAAHQAWSANIFTTVSDMFPKKAVGSVTGIGGMAGTLGSMVLAFAAGKLLAHYKLPEVNDAATAYSILFIICALAYIFAWGLMHLLAPKFKKITDL
jgi:MFS family permease